MPPGYPPPRKSNTGLVIGLVAGALALVVVLVVVLVIVGSNSDDKKKNTSSSGGPSTSTSASSPSDYPSTATTGTLKIQENATTAGGWNNDSAAETALSSDITQMRSTMTNAAGTQLTNIVTKFYKDPTGTAVGNRPAGVLFLGAEGQMGTPSSFVSSFISKAQSDGATAFEIDPGTQGGKGVCERITRNGISISFCAWATPTTLGMIVPTVPGRTSTQMADLMRRMRPDLEKSQ